MIIFNPSISETIVRLPQEGQFHVLTALRDPQTRPRVIEILKSFDPAGELARQAEQDIAEYVMPKGKPIVFKTIARAVGPRLVRAIDAMVDALPHQNTEGGDAAMLLAYASDEPAKDFAEYYQSIALDAFDPGAESALAGDEDFYWEYYGDPNLGGLFKKIGKSLKKVGKSLKKVAKKIPWRPIAVGAAVVVGTAASMLVPAVAPLAIQGVQMAAGKLLGGTSKGVQQVFAGITTAASIASAVATPSGGGSSPGISSALQAVTGVVKQVTQPKAPATQAVYIPPVLPTTSALTPAAAATTLPGAAATSYQQPAAQLTPAEITAAVKEAQAQQAQASSTGLASVPTWVWIAGGVAVVGVAAMAFSGRRPRARGRRR
jgi:hypothetical protein